MKILQFLFHLLLFCLLTVVTQIGGVVYLLHFFAYPFIRMENKAVRRLIRLAAFLVIYLATTFAIVPALAKAGGRVPLPIRLSHGVRPLTAWTCLLNRHYVRPGMREALYASSQTMQTKYPGIQINYLDAGFPFFDNFPLLPHLSHKDGKKLDIAFCYTTAEGIATNDVPSPIGYGICEGPRTGEINTTSLCESKGYWQYSLLEKIIPQGRKKEYKLHTTRTRDLVLAFAAQASIGTIFIEPHLVSRLSLNNSKIRFHGCQAVRHDDHVHVQLR